MNRLVSFEEIADSRELLATKSPRFILIFTWLLIVIVIVGCTWAWLGEVDQVVRAIGIVRPSGKISTVCNAINGLVVEVAVSDNQYVTAGELLYRIDTEAIDSSITSNRVMREELSEDIKLLQQLKTAMVQQDPNSLAEPDMKLAYDAYQAQYNRLVLEQDYAEDILSTAAAESALAAYTFEIFNSINQDLQAKYKLLHSLDDQIKSLEITRKLSTVSAPISGNIQFIRSVNPGDYLPSGIEILRIIPTNKTEYIVEITVRNEDIGRVELDQEIIHKLPALPYQEFGVISGTVIKIACDTQISSDGSLGYKLESDVDKAVVYDRSGSPHQLKAGMLCESRIIINREKIINMILKKLDFIQ